MAKQILDEAKFTDVRLPTCLRPTHYDLRLKPNFESFTFEGQVKISYQCTSNDKAPKSIVLHAKELEITDGFLDGGDKNVNPLAVVTYSTGTETATLEFQDDITPNGSISLNFLGKLNDKLKGFYRTSFKLDGVDIYAATTQFEATDARRCFPCWDEPAIKATFSVTLVIEKYIDVNGKKYERIPLSNMPEVSRSGPDGELEVKFDKSPIMSTYLLAIIIGPFDYVESECQGRPIRVYTTPGKKEQGLFALDVACKCMSYYEDYFSIPYPLPKMDLIAIPDFGSGAMENWGLITYRETCLLVDAKNTSMRVKQNVAIVVAHEFAHQWFGNLVTMEWWTHLWLNEGFASFMEHLCVDNIFPEYDIWFQFVSDAFSSALELDSLHNSHPIEVPVKHPDEIDEIFDIISYEKGASVIRMLYSYVGDSDFRKGMKDYLTKFAYKNASTEDLWDCLSAASGKPVRKVMHGWTAKKGYPWLSIDFKQEGNDVKLGIAQKKFSADGTLAGDDANTTWVVPLNASTADDPASSKQLGLFEGVTTQITIPNVGDKWIKLNSGSIGFYRVSYPDEMFKKLLPAISQRKLPAEDRLGLQNDYYALCKAGKVKTVNLLDLLLAYKDETDYTVWSSIDSCLSRLSLITGITDFKSKFHAYGSDLYKNIFARLTWSPKEGEKHLDALTRALVINRLVAFKDPEIIEHAKTLFTSHVNKTSILPADLRGAVYRAASVHGDEKMFQDLFTIFRTEELQEEKNRAARALGFTEDTNRRKKVIDFALSDEVRNQDKVFVIMTICAASPESGWKLFLDNQELFKERYGSSHLMTRLVKFCTENFATHEKANEIAKFFKENQFSGCERTILQSIESIKLNADWLKRDEASMRSYLSARVPSTA